MTKLGDPKYVAKVLAGEYRKMTRPQFSRTVDGVFRESSPHEISEVAEHLPEHIAELLPRRLLH